MPLLHYAFGFGLRAAVATSLCLVWANALASTGAELLHTESAFEWPVVLPLVGGAFLGAQLGYRASTRLDERTVKGVFAMVMVLASVRLLFGSLGSGEVGDYAESYGIGHGLMVAGIGVVAGASSPLLGIGGGLIVVPGLLFVLPELGMLGARAAALGNAVVTSSRSIQLYRREGAIDRTLSPWIVGGALVGAIGGVQVVHLDGVAQVGRFVLCLLLALTAVRMGFDALANREAGGASDGSSDNDESENA